MNDDDCRDAADITDEEAQELSKHFTVEELRKIQEGFRKDDNLLNLLDEFGLKHNCWRCKKLIQRHSKSENVIDDIKEHKKWHEELGI